MKNLIQTLFTESQLKSLIELWNSHLEEMHEENCYFSMNTEWEQNATTLIKSYIKTNFSDGFDLDYENLKNELRNYFICN